MGFNASVIVMNDALDTIADDPLFGANLADAIMRLGVNSGKPVDVAARSKDGRRIHVNAATVIEDHHADHISIIAFGGNCGQDLGYVWGIPNSPENKVEILKRLAQTLGYTLHKKSKKS